MARKHDLENLLNGQLAGLLTEAGVPAQAEVKQGNRRLDILADVDGLRVVLEAETGFDKQAQAIKDADARFKQGLTTLAFAVCYPGGATVDSLAEAEFQWLLRTAVQGLGTPVRQALAKRLDLSRGKPTAQDDGYFTAAKRGMLVVAMAMLFHHRVHEHLPPLRPSDYQGDWPPRPASVCCSEGQSRDAYATCIGSKH